MQIHATDLAHFCPTFNAELAWMSGTSDFLIAAVYILIPFRLWRIIKLLPDDLAPEIKRFSVLLAAFVITCGFTHLFKVISIFAGYEFWLFAGVFNWITAIVSLAAYLYLERKALNPLLHAARSFRKMGTDLSQMEAELKEAEAKIDAFENTYG